MYIGDYYAAHTRLTVKVAHSRYYLDSALSSETFFTLYIQQLSYCPSTATPVSIPSSAESGFYLSAVHSLSQQLFGLFKSLQRSLQ